jgi:hypothetical protein
MRKTLLMSRMRILDINNCIREINGHVALVHCLLSFTLSSINRTNGESSERFTNGTRLIMRIVDINNAHC